MCFASFFASIRSLWRWAPGVLAVAAWPAHGHGVSDDAYALFLRLQVNSLGTLVEGYCAASPAESKARAAALTASVLPRPLTVDEICQGQCRDEDNSTLSREQVEETLASMEGQPAPPAPDAAACDMMLTWLDSLQQRFGQPLGALLLAERADVPRVVHAPEVVPGPVWRGDGGWRAIGTLGQQWLKVQLDFLGPTVEVRAMGLVLDAVKPQPYAFKVTIWRSGHCCNDASPPPEFKRVVLRLRGKTFVPESSVLRSDDPQSLPSRVVTFAPEGDLGAEPLEIEIGPLRDGKTVYPPLVFRTEEKPAGLLRAPTVLLELAELIGHGKPKLPERVRIWQ